jgi:hypothetical protein
VLFVHALAARKEVLRIFFGLFNINEPVHRTIVRMAISRRIAVKERSHLKSM